MITPCIGAKATGVSERDAIRRFTARYPLVGDDAAVLDDGLLAAADVIVEGIDFLDRTPPADIGWRAVAVNVSDIAAMGGSTHSVLVSVVGPDSTDLDAIYVGVDEACSAFGCEVAGGDLSGGERLVIAVTALGRCANGVTPVLRSGARPGDRVWVSGPLGGAAAGGYVDRPRPRHDLGPLLARLGATAMIDVSDGFSLDLLRLCESSAVGVDIDESAVPIAEGASMRQAFAGGDDYELLFTLPAGVDPPSCHAVGTIVDDFASRPAPDGWQHRFS